MMAVGFLLPTLCLLYCAVRAWYFIWWRPKNLERVLRQQGIHGNPYKLFWGDLKEEMKTLTESWSKPMSLNHQITPRASPFIHKTLQKYGKMSLIWHRTKPRVIIQDPEMMREILSDKSGHVMKPPLNPLITILATGVAISEGEEWAKRRKTIQPAFHLEKLKGMVPAFSSSCEDLIKRWERSIGADGSCELDVCPEFHSLSGDVISRTAFGSSYEEGKRIFELQKELVVLVLDAARTVYLPGLRFIPTAKNKQRMYLDREIKSMLRNLIQKKEQSIKMGESCRDDLLGLLLQYTDYSKDEENSTQKYKMTLEDVIEECKLFYFAGQATSSAWLTWTVIVLAMHQDWQDKAREEVLQICGRNKPDLEAINRFKIVTMILNEVLRLYPPGPSQLRYTHKEMKLGEINIPAGIELILPTIFVHHDPELWGEDAQEFNPERFSQGVAKASKQQNTFFPFGWGPRICIGQSFAFIEAKMALARILQHFSFELSPSYAHAPYTGLHLEPQYGAQVILRRL